ncbi:uncharacterized protein LOC124374894 [Homalodisca vitripennis]|uniref:uncharacterized protein LOC124374894 n=1 Tax=Homalodisca vitripennis TaxID=197043 RepID=UPI001EE9DA66|nr:uncharacterized protein LOC124374894 [Homalodisca vitripennis]
MPGRSNEKPGDAWSALKRLQLKLQQRATKRSAYSLRMSEVSPTLAGTARHSDLHAWPPRSTHRGSHTRPHRSAPHQDQTQETGLPRLLMENRTHISSRGWKICTLTRGSCSS